MKYIDTFREGMHVAEVYLCKNKQIALTKNGKEYGNLVLQDKTGTIDAKIWDLGSPGVGEFETMDYVHVEADVTLFQSSYQLNVRRIRRARRGNTGRRIIFRYPRKTLRRCTGSCWVLWTVLKIRI